MLLPIFVLQVAELLLSVSLLTGVTLAATDHSEFHIKAHGTGYRHAGGSGRLNAKDIGITTTNDLSYTVDITLGGEPFTVLLDTGSTDLWVNTQGRNVKLTHSSGLTTKIAFVVGEVEGAIDFAELRIGDFVIESQAFLNASSVSNIDLTSMDGVMGMAFDNADIYQTIQREWGTDAADEFARAPITSLFAQHPTLPNNFDVQLARTSELNDIAEGTFVISGHDKEFAAVTDAPHLPRINQKHWSLPMEAMNINGSPFAFNKSHTIGAPSGTIIAVLDTGFSFPPLPPAAVDAIYSSVPGAEFDPVAQLWIVPCCAATNLSFVFGGQEFVVHPLDLTFPLVTVFEIDGAAQNVTVCINTYQYLTFEPDSDAGFDIVLGDAFLRNVYASFDYGDYYPANHTNGLPFVQMLSTTNVSSMWDEFDHERTVVLAELPPELSPEQFVSLDEQQAASASVQQLSTVAGAAASGDGSSTDDSWGKKYGMVALVLLGANLVIGIVLLAATLTMCVRGMKGKGDSRYAPVRFKTTVADDYETGTLKYSD